MSGPIEHPHPVRHLAQVMMIKVHILTSEQKGYQDQKAKDLVKALHLSE
jgi:hypothetical protein